MDSSKFNLSAADSAAKFLQDLHLAGRSPPATHMDSMEVDLLLEDPDTPDRLASPVGDVGEDAARETYHQTRSKLSLHCEKTSSSNAFNNESLFREARLTSLISKPHDAVSLHCEKTSSSNSFNNESLFREARLAPLISEPHDAELYHDKKKFLFGISPPTRRRRERRKMAWDVHGENKAGCSYQLKGRVSSSSGQIRGTCNGIANSMALTNHTHGAGGNQGINENAVSGGVSEQYSTSDVAESNFNGDRISLSSDSQAMTEKAASKHHLRQFEQRRLVRQGLIYPNNVKGHVASTNEESCSSCAGRTVLDKGKGIYLSRHSQNKSEHTFLELSQFDIPRKNSGQRRLVKNGFISPLNIEKSRNATNCEKDGSDKVDVCEIQDDFLFPQLRVVGPDCEPRQTNLRDDAKSSFMSSRELLPGKGKVISEEVITEVQPAADIGWRIKHSHAGKAVQHSSQEISVVSNRYNDHFHPSNQEHESSVYATDSFGAADPCPFTYESTSSQFQGSSEVKFELNPNNERHYRAARLARGKRKTRPNRTLLGECSSSSFIMSGALHPELSGETSNAKSMRGHSPRCHGVTLQPITDVDELPSPVLISDGDCNRSCIGSELVARAQQVESDEMLARQLQEQFFNEASSVGGSEEIDSTIAWTLQQEEDAQHASFVRSRGQSNPRSPSIAYLYRQYPRQSSYDSSMRSTSRACVTPSTRMTQLRRNVRHGMDLEARLSFLEALEVAYNSGTDLGSDILHVQHDFNENDYEMLLALDEDNHQHMGASLHQINSLPQTVIQTENVEEVCAICLEKPSTGDVIRHLPCLHKFHKDCIDTWLTRRTLCPICKSEIT